MECRAIIHLTRICESCVSLHTVPQSASVNLYRIFYGTISDKHSQIAKKQNQRAAYDSHFGRCSLYLNGAATGCVL